MLFRAMTGLVTVYHGTALAAGLRIKLGNQEPFCDGSHANLKGGEIST